MSLLAQEHRGLTAGSTATGSFFLEPGLTSGVTVTLSMSGSAGEDAVEEFLLKGPTDNGARGRRRRNQERFPVYMDGWVPV